MTPDPLETPRWLSRAIDATAGIAFLVGFLALWFVAA